MEQLDAFSSVRDREQRDGEYPAQFWQWLEANEHIYRAFVELALQAKARGFPRWSRQAILEHLRWRTALRDGYAHAVKINNSAGSGLARLAMAEHPQLLGFFEIRRPPARDSAVRLDGTHYTEEARL